MSCGNTSYGKQFVIGHQLFYLSSVLEDIKDFEFAENPEGIELFRGDIFKGHIGVNLVEKVFLFLFPIIDVFGVKNSFSGIPFVPICARCGLFQFVARGDGVGGNNLSRAAQWK